MSLILEPYILKVPSFQRTNCKVFIDRIINAKSPATLILTYCLLYFAPFRNEREEKLKKFKVEDQIFEEDIKDDDDDENM